VFRADLRRIEKIEAPGGITLVYARSSVYAATPYGGGGYSYSRPLMARHESSGEEISIRDHVMTLRLGMLALFATALISRWILGR
jgi:hypothetical protein